MALSLIMQLGEGQLCSVFTIFFIGLLLFLKTLNSKALLAKKLLIIFLTW